jgi:hypothetical protein
VIAGDEAELKKQLASHCEGMPEAQMHLVRLFLELSLLSASYRSLAVHRREGASLG